MYRQYCYSWFLVLRFNSTIKDASTLLSGVQPKCDFVCCHVNPEKIYGQAYFRNSFKKTRQQKMSTILEKFIDSLQIN